MMNIYAKYRFDILIISGSYGGHRRHTMDDGRRTMPQVWHKLPIGELTIKSLLLMKLIFSTDIRKKHHCYIHK